MNERKLLQARVPDSSIKQLKDLAKQKGVSLNALIIFIIQEYIERNK